MLRPDGLSGPGAEHHPHPNELPSLPRQYNPRSDAEITQPAEEEIQVPEESPAIKEKQAKIDKLLSETGSGEMTKDEEKKLNELYKANRRAWQDEGSGRRK